MPKPTQLVKNGWTYYLRNRATSRYLDSNAKGDVYALEYNGGGYQKWKLMDTGGGYFFLQDEATGRVLDSNGRGAAYTLGLNGGGYQQWRIDRADDGHFWLLDRETNLRLDSAADGRVYTLDGNSGPYQQWRFEPDVTWSTAVDSFQYGTAVLPPSQADVIGTQVINNPSQAEVTETVAVTRSIESTFEWGLTETLTVGASLTWKAGVPFGGAEGQINVSLELGSHQTWVETTTLTYTTERVVSVPPMTCVKVSSYVDWVEDLTVPFELKAKMYAAMAGQSLPGADIKMLLTETGDVTKVVQELPYSVIVLLRGDVSGSYGIDTRSDTVPCAEQEALDAE